MRIIFYDAMQDSDAPAALISAALADTWDDTDLDVSFGSEISADCIGIGNTDATEITLQLGVDTSDSEIACIDGTSGYSQMGGVDGTGGDAILASIGGPEVQTVALTETGTLLNGLYYLGELRTLNYLHISHNGTYIGRFALGVGVTLGCSPSREPGLWSTSEPRRTLSGQVIPGAGGVVGREIQVDVKYKITESDFAEIEAGHAQFGIGLPLFILFDWETLRFPWLRLYASAEIDMTFQSSVMRHKLYSRQFKFKEAF